MDQKRALNKFASDEQQVAMILLLEVSQSLLPPWFLDLHFIRNWYVETWLQIRWKWLKWIGDSGYYYGMGKSDQDTQQKDLTLQLDVWGGWTVNLKKSKCVKIRTFSKRGFQRWFHKRISFEKRWILIHTLSIPKLILWYF